MTDVLIIVDMQAHFPCSQDRGLRGRIEHAAGSVISTGGHVIVLAYDAGGEFTVRAPEGTRTVWKKEDDGGDEVYAYLVGADLIDEDNRYIFAGVNLSACVWKTAVALASRLHDEDAISDSVIIAPSLCGDGSRFKIRFEDPRIMAP